MPPLPDHYNKSEIDHIEKVQRRAARFVTNWRNTSSVAWTGAVLKTCIKMFNLSCNIKRKLVIIQTDRLKSPLRQSQNMHSSSFIIPPTKTQQRQESFFYDIRLEPFVCFRCFSRSLLFVFVSVLFLCFRVWYLLPFFLYLCSFILIDFSQSARIVSYIRNNRFWNLWTCTFCIEIFV